MDRQRRFTFQEALRQMQIVFDDVDNDSDAEDTSASDPNLFLMMTNFLCHLRNFLT